MKKCLVGFMGVCLLIVIAREAHAAGKVTVFESNATAKFQNAVYDRLILVKVENKDDFKRLTGFFLTRTPQSTRRLLWDITLRIEDKQGVSFCASKKEMEYDSLMRDHVQNIPLLADSREWSLQTPQMADQLKKELLMKNSAISNVDIKPNHPFSSNQNLKPTAFVKEQLEGCDETIEWEEIRGKLVAYLPPGISAKSPQSTQIIEKTQETKIEQELRSKTHELDILIKELNREKDKKDDEINSLRNEMISSKFFTEGLQKYIYDLQKKLSEKEDNVFLRFFSVQTLSFFIIFLCLFSFLTYLLNLLHKEIKKITSINKSREELSYYRDFSTRIIENLLESLENHNIIFNDSHRVRIENSVENVISSISSCLPQEYLKNNRKEAWIHLKDMLKSTSKEIKDAYMSRKKTHGNQQFSQLEETSLILKKHLDNLLEYVSYLYETSDISCKTLKKNQLELEELKDDYSNILQIHEDFEINYNIISENYSTLKKDFESNKHNERILRKSCMVRDGWLDAGADESKTDSSWSIYDERSKGGYRRAFSICLTGLKEFLQALDPQEFPGYYNACGVDTIRQKLQKIESYGRYFYGDEDEQRKYIESEWIDKLWPIFQAELLMKTYWPDLNGSAKNTNLLDELNHTKETILYVLKKYGIEPHSLVLLDQDEIVDVSRVISDSNTPLNPYLKNDVNFQEKVKLLAEKAPTYFDVSFWGYDLNGKLKLESKLIVKAPNEAL